MPRPEMPPQPDHSAVLGVITVAFLAFVLLVATGLYKWLV